MKVIRITLGIFILLIVFVGSVLISDRYREYRLKENIKRVQPGMTAEEVIAIMGRPTSHHMSDIPGEYWCWGSDSFEDHPEYCGKVMLEMGPGKRVVSISPVIP